MSNGFSRDCCLEQSCILCWVATDANSKIPKIFIDSTSELLNKETEAVWLCKLDIDGVQVFEMAEQSTFLHGDLQMVQVRLLQVELFNDSKS